MSVQHVEMDSVSNGQPPELLAFFFQLQLTADGGRVSASQLMLLHLKSTLKNIDYICFRSHIYVINNCLNEYIIPIYSCMSSLLLIN